MKSKKATGIQTRKTVDAAQKRQTSECLDSDVGNWERANCHVVWQTNKQREGKGVGVRKRGMWWA